MSEMTPEQQSKVLGDHPGHLTEEIAKLIEAVGRGPGAVRGLSDQLLLTVAKWIELGDPAEDPGAKAVLAECRQRARQGHAFAVYLDVPTFGEYLLRRALDQS